MCVLNLHLPEVSPWADVQLIKHTGKGDKSLWAAGKFLTWFLPGNCFPLFRQEEGRMGSGCIQSQIYCKDKRSSDFWEGLNRLRPESPFCEGSSGPGNIQFTSPLQPPTSQLHLPWDYPTRSWVSLESLQTHQSRTLLSSSLQKSNEHKNPQSDR